MMNRIRIAAAAAALLIGAATVAEAQQTSAPRPGKRGAMAQHGANGMMMDSLNLTNAQKEQIQAIHAKYRLRLEALRDSTRPNAQAAQAARAARQAGDTAAARAAMERMRAHGTTVAAIRQQEHAEVRAVLTADQRAKLDAKHAQMRERMAQHDSSGKAHPRGMRGRRPMGGARPARPARPAQPRRQN